VDLARAGSLCSGVTPGRLCANARPDLRFVTADYVAKLHDEWMTRCDPRREEAYKSVLNFFFFFFFFCMGFIFISVFAPIANARDDNAIIAGWKSARTRRHWRRCAPPRIPSRRLSGSAMGTG
jgi:hypothetical protein